MRLRPSSVPFALSLAVMLFPALGVEWNQWRGPRRDGHSPDQGLPKRWPPGGPKRLWTTKNVGLGYSGVVTADKLVFTMGTRDGKEHLIALHAKDGTEYYFSLAGNMYTNAWGNGPRMTPTIDDDRLYAMSGKGKLICIIAKSGKFQWEKQLTTDLGGTIPDWGYSESPLVVDDVVIVTPGGTNGTLAALNKKNGKLVWQTSGLTEPAHYTSPIAVSVGGRKQIVQLASRKLFGVDPATGRVLWDTAFPGRIAVVPTPIDAGNGYVYATASYGAGSKLVKIAPDGNSVEIVYEDNRVMRNQHGGVVLVDGKLYGHSDGSGWVCQDLLTGAEVWRFKDYGKGSVHFADGMLYCLNEQTAELALVDASPLGWTERSRFKLDPLSKKRSREGGIWTHPTVINGRLYLRDQELLTCYELVPPPDHSTRARR